MREILLDPKLLVMNIVIRRIVTFKKKGRPVRLIRQGKKVERKKGWKRRTEEVLKRVKGKGETAMIIDGLGGRDTKEDGGLSDRHAGDQMSDDGTQGIENEALEGMVVKCAKGVRTVETMMNRVNVLVEELVDVEGAVPEVLPGVEDKAFLRE